MWTTQVVHLYVIDTLYVSAVYNIMHSVAETPIFTRRADALLTRDDRAILISTLAENPLAGDLVPGLGGIRKLRFAPAGRGKSGAFRVIHYYAGVNLPVLALLIYAKNEQDNISARSAPGTVSHHRRIQGATARCEERDSGMKDSRQGSPLADELIASLREGVEILTGRQAPSRFYPAPAKVDVRAIRTGLGLSQTAFASRFGFSPGAVREWEQGTAAAGGGGAHAAAGDREQAGGGGRGAGGGYAAGGLDV